ncbi:BMP family lipoprotein [Mariluticola halotolerans]|uniref:BMP family lipoprotein n=1 Tax=Mariluticola halotolerans TaxID=2909283 RepID=UPI0026E18BF1|nr:BMP family ABC transporter substrate-binding protein [Mariluticola halotolerans]UJQ93180.1 BMP family ABC transporter substrate-binding protein [Mariluticola halotolerans]
MSSRTLTKQLAARAGILAGGVALSALLVGTALAEPALIYDAAGKNDKSFNEMAYNGAEMYKAESGNDYSDLEISEDSQREQALRRFASRGATPIVVPGFTWEAPVQVVAAEFPDTHFAIIDAVVDLPNVRSILFKEQEGSFLVGALAAMKSETGTVGFVTAFDFPLLQAFGCGYVQGAKAVNPDITVLQNFIGTDFAAFNDSNTASEVAISQMERGADVIYAAAGGAGEGALQAVSDAGKFGIGVDSNQNYLFPGNMLTSMVKRVDVAVANAFADEEAGNWTSGVQILGLAEGGVSAAIDDDNKDLITAEMQAKVDELTAKIGSGEIVVHDYRETNSCPVS